MKTVLIVTLIFTTLLKFVMFVTSYRIFQYTFYYMHAQTQIFFYLSGFFSIILGCFGALAQERIRKFLAFSSINQMGFVFVG